MATPVPVERTTNISFDPSDKTFRLYTSKSIYAFSVSPELVLEHLHWGESLPEGYDLRYLCQSSRNTHFSVTEVAPDRFGGKIVLEAETLEDIQSTWRENRVWAPKDMDELEQFQHRRLENFSWRIMSKISIHDCQKQNKLSSTSRRGSLRSLASTSDLHSIGRKPQLGTIHEGTLVDKYDIGPIDAMHSNLRKTLKTAPSEANLTLLKEKSIQTMSEQASINYKHPILDNIKSGQQKHKRSHRFNRTIGKVGRGGLCVEFADHGTGDFRTPSFLIVDNFNGSSISPLRYRRHRIYKGKLNMPDGMPGIKCEGENDASTLVVTLADVITGIEVDIIYVVMHNHDAMTRRTVFRNVDKRKSCSSIMLSNNNQHFECGGSNKVILKASSVSIDFEAEPHAFHLIQLSGSWARERMVVESRLVQGMQSFGSVRGVSSHQHNPFAAISFGTPHETKGEVRGFSFVYSGNFLAEAELGEMGRLRFNMGIHPMGMQWHLKSGEFFATPEVVMVRSSEGTGGMSRTFHRLFLDRLLPKTWSDEHPPIVLNTWEAKYFHVTHANVVEMAAQAVKIGVNLIVLDDGWFGTRNDDSSSLGDWIVNLTKFPKGLCALVEEVNALGCKFGIWIEPEMVSENSALFQAHRDWYLHVPGRPPQVGRNQVVLDLSRKDVRDHVYNAISNLLRSANIEYVKWDMNRPLTEVYSQHRSCSGVWQSEISHRYVLGLYELQSQLTRDFPHVLLENCASGGGRFDPGMLYYGSQFWCSDNTDALVRMRIQYGTSLVYPTRTIGAHISAVPNHLTGNVTRLRTRGFVAMCGTFGFELDVSTLSPKDIVSFKRFSEVYLDISPTIRFGDMFRLWHPFKLPLTAWMYVNARRHHAVVFAFSLNSDHWSNLVPRLLLQGLDPDADYEITEPIPNNVTQSTGNVMLLETEVPVYQLGSPSVILTGKILMTAGLPVRFYTLDDSVMFVLHKMSCSETSSTTA